MDSSALFFEALLTNEKVDKKATNATISVVVN